MSEPRSRKAASAAATAAITTKKPKDGAFYQQSLPAWQPIMTPRTVIAVFIIIGIIFIPVGVTLMQNADAIYEELITYDNGQANSQCPVNSGPCALKFTLARDVSSDLHVYYQLSNYYQNHRVYVASRSSDQLQGKAADRTKAEKDCSTKVFSNTSQLLYPCGLIANSFFTDTITLITPTLTMKQTDIAWPSDKVKYQQITGFSSKEVTCGTTSCAPLPSSCKSFTDSTTGKCYMYYYPDDDKVQYLYETYPNIISPLKGVTDEHFMVWMRTAALPTFRKPYGVVAGPFKKGDVLLFTVNPLYEVKSFGGTKTLVISTVGQFGGKNIYLGAGYVVVGGLSFLLSFMFVVKSQLNSRPIGDPSLLTWSS